LVGIRKEGYEAKIDNFFRYAPFLLEIVSISQFLTKTNDSNTHLRKFFMLYTNQITKIRKLFILVHFGLILDLAGPSIMPNFGFFFIQNTGAPIQVEHYFRN
jgi:hypothetical protein